MSFQPHGKLANRSFVGLLIAQFQAAFSDQAIQASAMFYAIRMKTLPESVAISLLPILFFSPWAIFVTWAGYLSDKYSKQYAIRFWKVFEVGIVIVTFSGFLLGSTIGQEQEWARYLGSYLVMSTVFLMGMQSAFFVPAKYGIMPEMLQPHLLSRGNGLLESLSFLAIILGTVAGGVLIWVFGPESYFGNLANHEAWIGVILIGLSAIGAVCSFMVERVPAANPQRLFPFNPLTPIVANLRTLTRSRPLLFAILGIAFFTFMVAFTRNTMYMHGESRIDRWSEMHTSLVVGVVALGIGFGSPLAGYLSGGKVELGLVPIGAVGMIVALFISALVLNVEPALIVCVGMTGFFTGFYIVPLFTLLQHRAPKESKGDLIASSNFINVIGAIIATTLFFGIVHLSSWVGVIYPVATSEVVRGELISLQKDKFGAFKDFTVRIKPGETYQYSLAAVKVANDKVDATVLEKEGVVEEKKDDRKGTNVVVIRYDMVHQGPMFWSEDQLVEHVKIVQGDLSPLTVENKERLPRYLFLGAGIMTLLILLLLRRQLPDLFARSLLWMRSRGRYHLKVVGIQNLPQEEAAILATNCDTHETALQVVAVTDRSITFLLQHNPEEKKPGFQVRYLARNTDILDLPADGESTSQWDVILRRGGEALQKGNLLGITVASPANADGIQRVFDAVHQSWKAPIIPVYIGTLTGGEDHVHEPLRNVRVVIGEAVPDGASLDEIRQRIHLLGEWIHQAEQGGGIASTAVMPGSAEALPETKERVAPQQPPPE